MKYLEPVKSVVLFLLVMLSVVLTFLNWTYTPDYKVIEKTEEKEIQIGPQKKMEDVIRPYKAIYRFDKEFTGTVSNAAMEDIMKSFVGWNIDLVRDNNNLTASSVNEMIRSNNCMTIFFAGEIPYSAFSSIFQFADKELPETTFNRMVIDWSNYNNKELQVFFISSNNETLMRAHVSLQNANQFVRNVIEPAKTYDTFKEVERDGFTSLYIDNDKVESTKYTYFINEKSPDVFKDVLFTEPNVVQRTDESPNSVKYQDGTSLMTVDKNLKSLIFVYPTAESSVKIEPSKLLTDSFEFINEHGGFTADYRYVSTSTNNNQLDYQLYLHGLPVFSDQAINRITTVWGDNRIFRYKRPYYSLGTDIPSEKETKELPSGSEIVEKIQKLNNTVLSDLDDIVVGYYLTQDKSKQNMTLEPCWFAISNGVWTNLTPETLGGVKNGLE